MYEEERKTYAEEIYKNIIYEIEHNLKIALKTDERFATPFRVSYFILIQDVLSYVSETLRDEIRSLYAKLEEINIYIERINLMGLFVFRQDYFLQYQEYLKLMPRILPSLQKALTIAKIEYYFNPPISQ
jgi:hypothetical protein